MAILAVQMATSLVVAAIGFHKGVLDQAAPAHSTAAAATKSATLTPRPPCTWPTHRQHSSKHASSLATNKNNNDDVSMQLDTTAGILYCHDCTNFSGSGPANLLALKSVVRPKFTPHANLPLTPTHTTLDLALMVACATHDMAAQIAILASNPLALQYHCQKAA